MYNEKVDPRCLTIPEAFMTIIDLMFVFCIIIIGATHNIFEIPMYKAWMGVFFIFLLFMFIIQYLFYLVMKDRIRKF